VFLKIQKELMEKAQEIFRTANKATRPEKEHILKFMAGTRGKIMKLDSVKYQNIQYILFIFVNLL